MCIRDRDAVVVGFDLARCAILAGAPSLPNEPEDRERYNGYHQSICDSAATRTVKPADSQSSQQQHAGDDPHDAAGAEPGDQPEACEERAEDRSCLLYTSD